MMEIKNVNNIFKQNISSQNLSNKKYEQDVSKCLNFSSNENELLESDLPFNAKTGNIDLSSLRKTNDTKESTAKPTNEQQNSIDNLIKQAIGNDVTENIVDETPDGEPRRILKNSNGDKVIIVYDQYGRVKSVEVARKSNKNNANYDSGYTYNFKYKDDGTIEVDKTSCFHIDDNSEMIKNHGMRYPACVIDKDGNGLNYVENPTGEVNNDPNLDISAPKSDAENVIKPNDEQQKTIDEIVNTLIGDDIAEDTTDKTPNGETRRIIKNSNGDRVIVIYDQYGRVKSVETGRKDGWFHSDNAEYQSGYTLTFRYNEDGSISVDKTGVFHYQEDPDGKKVDNLLFYPSRRIGADGKYNGFIAVSAREVA